MSEMLAQEILNKLNVLINNQEGMQEDIISLKTNQKEIVKNQKNMAKDITTLKLNQRVMKKDIRLLKKGQIRLNNRIEAVLMDVDLIDQKAESIKKAM